jgi:uncharacterized membrane protein YhaH (DUF805 family)
MLQNVRHIFKSAFKFSGRASRWEFWSFVWFVLAVSFVLTIVNAFFFGPETTSNFSVTQNLSSGEVTQAVSTRHEYNSGWFGTIFGCIVLLPLVSLSWRRIQDNNRPGWIVLIPTAMIFGMSFVTSRAVATVEVDPSLRAQAPDLPATIQRPALPTDPYLTLGLIFAVLIPFAYVMRFFFRPTPHGPNKYGPNPHEVPS